MLFIILVCIVVFIYYKCNKKYPDLLCKKYHMYFGIGVGGILIIYYLINYEKSFVNNVLHNIKTVDNKPLYDLSLMQEKKEDNMILLKNKMAINQNWRCHGCHNIIPINELNNYNINYKKSLKTGGRHNLQNLGLYCNICNKYNIQ